MKRSLRNGWLPLVRPRAVEAAEVAAVAPAPARAEPIVRAAELGARWREVLFALLAAGLPALVFLPFLRGTVNLYGDLGVYYWPATKEVATAFNEGRLPLWTPNLFGGYPFFADGEAGTLYPTNLLLLAIFPAEAVFPYLTLPALMLAGLFSYFLARTLGLGRFAALLAGWAFAFSGYCIGHLEHPNLLNSSVWLPGVIACLERAVRASGRRRVLWTLAGAGGYALSWLGVHPHAPLVIGITVGAYAVLRAFGRPLRVAPVALAFAMLVGGLALAAVQVVPMYELGTYSGRGEGVPYEFNLQYAFPLPNLVTFLLPFFFLSPAWIDWGLWGRGEIAVYVGLLPLALAFVGLAAVRRRQVAFWGGVAAVSLLIMFANYSPLNLHRWLVEIPGFSVLRAPGRFALTLDLALALLAAFGAEGLLRLRMGDWGLRNAGLVGRWRGLPRGVRGVLLGSAVVAVVTPFALLLAHGWVGANREATLRLVADWYLAAPRALKTMWPSEVVDNLLYATDFRFQRLAVQVGLLVVSVLVLFGAALGRGAVRLLRRGAFNPWLALIALVVAADLLSFAFRFYPDPEPAGILETGNPAMQVAADYLHERGGRIYTSPGTVGLAPNRLLALNAPELGGYSSLESRRHAAYIARVERADSPLLDRLGAQLWAVPTRRFPERIYRNVWFHREIALVSLDATVPPERATFHFRQITASRLRLVALLADAADARQDEPVAEVTLRGPDGREKRVTLRAGRDVAEWDFRRPEVAAALRHTPGEIAAERLGRAPTGETFNGALFYSDQWLEAAFPVDELTVRYLRPSGRLDIHGITLMHGTDAHHVERVELTRYHELYRDNDLTIFENRLAMPRAVVLHRAKAVRPWESLAATEAIGVALNETATVETEGPLPPLSGGPSEPARVTAEDRSGVTVQFESDGDGLLLLADTAYPGWRATLDGRPVDILRADYLFRAVAVPAGAHTVRFTFDPLSVKVGAGISALALLAVAALLTRLFWRRPTVPAEAAPPAAPRSVRGRLLRWSLVLGIALAGFGAGVGIGLAAPSYPGDTAHYKYWTHLVSTQGIHNSYAGEYPQTYAIYPPLTLYLDRLVGAVYARTADPGFDLARALESSYLTNLLKLPGLFFHFLTALAVYCFARRLASYRWAAAAAAAYALNPAVLFDLTFWTQPDTVHSFFLLLSFGLLAERRPTLSWGAYALAALTKPQAWVLAPLLVVLTLRRHGLRPALTGGALAAALALAVVSPYLRHGTLDRLLTLPGQTAAVMPFASANAHNLWWIVTGAQREPFVPDATLFWGNLSYLRASVPLILAVLGLALWRSGDAPRARIYELAAFTAFGFVMMATKVHENHFFYVLPLLAPVWLRRRHLWPVFPLVTLTLLANMVLHDTNLEKEIQKILAAEGWRNAQLFNAWLNLGVLVYWAGTLVPWPALARRLGLPAPMARPEAAA